MIRRENLRQAIEAIGRRDPEVGYALDEMLGMGLIDAASAEEDDGSGEDFFFLFEDQKVPVKKFIFVNEGTAGLEQGLLIKYGELIRKRQLLQGRERLAYLEAAREIRRAGLEFMVRHEIDSALKRQAADLAGLEAGGSEAAREEIDFKRRLVARLEELRTDRRPLPADPAGDDPDVLYRGLVGADAPARFARFPLCLDSLIQVAAANAEFFHVRFILNCLSRGLLQNLFACLAEQGILGLIYLTLRERIFYQGLEVKFMAALRGGRDEGAARRPAAPPGVGTFLIAGVWLLWQSGLSGVRELVLDAEVGARGFYESAGFHARGLSEYVLKDPRGYLIRAILIMASNLPGLEPELGREIAGLIGKQVKGLAKKARRDKDKSVRKGTLAAIRAALGPGARPEFAQAAVQALLKYRKKIPEAEELLRLASAAGRNAWSG